MGRRRDLARDDRAVPAKARRTDDADGAAFIAKIGTEVRPAAFT
jgi:hypothetical protein